MVSGWLLDRTAKPWHRQIFQASSSCGIPAAAPKSRNGNSPAPSTPSPSPPMAAILPPPTATAPSTFCGSRRRRRQNRSTKPTRWRRMATKGEKLMNTATSTLWVYLEPRPKSAYRQLFVKGTRIRADVIYGLHVCAGDPMTPEQIAEEYRLPLEAVQEALAYCAANPPEI